MIYLFCVYLVGVVLFMVAVTVSGWGDIAETMVTITRILIWPIYLLKKALE